jgi:hypothetical protein
MEFKIKRTILWNILEQKNDYNHSQASKRNKSRINFMLKIIQHYLLQHLSVMTLNLSHWKFRLYSRFYWWLVKDHPIQS